MDYNVVPSLTMKEVGLDVKITLKFQVDHPSIDDHSVFFSRII